MGVQLRMATLFLPEGSIFPTVETLALTYLRLGYQLTRNLYV